MSTRDGITPPPLPELSDERIDEIEQALFAGIAREREARQDRERREHEKRARRRRTVWWTTAAAAVVIVAAAAIGPALGGLTMATGGADTAETSAGDRAAVDPAAGGFVGDGAEEASSAEATGPVSPADREIIATAQATVQVDDVAAAAQRIGAAAQQRGGYVESMSIGEEGPVVFDERMGEVMPYPVSGAWITVRVPADELTGAIDELSALGTVVSSSISRQDVTEQAVDLRARIDALSASVDRLTELMGQAGSVADLIAAESALSQRQAELESYQQQLQSLESQVSLSSLTVSLTPVTEPVTADPAGFGDGLVTGWNGLVATLNAVVVAMGFLLPWLAVAAVIAVVVWAIVRARRRGGGRGDTDADAHADVGGSE